APDRRSVVKVNTSALRVHLHLRGPADLAAVDAAAEQHELRGSGREVALRDHRLLAELEHQVPVAVAVHVPDGRRHVALLLARDGRLVAVVVAERDRGRVEEHDVEPRIAVHDDLQLVRSAAQRDRTARRLLPAAGDGDLGADRHDPADRDVLARDVPRVADDLAVVVDAVRGAEVAADPAEVVQLAVLPQERAPARAAADFRDADDLAQLVDVERLAARAAERAQVQDLAILPQDRVDLAGRRRALAGDVAPLVDRERARVAAAGQRGQLPHHAVLPQERAVVGPADHLPAIVDVERLGVVAAAERAEVPHGAVLPEEAAARAVGGEAQPDDLAVVVLAVRVAPRAAERAQVVHRAVLPEERTAIAVAGRAGARDAPARVDRRGGRAARAGVRAQVRQRAVLPAVRAQQAVRVLAPTHDLPQVV